MGKESDKEQIKPGSLLIAGAYLIDPNFARSVILLCENVGPGSFGLILNHPTEMTVKDFISGLSWDAPILKGGPVEESSLHFIHCNSDVQMESLEVIPGVFWGGNFEELTKHIEDDSLKPSECRFFIGYSGWGPGQLREEILTESWFVQPAERDFVFDDDQGNIWRKAMRKMGRGFKILANFPDDPKLN